MIDKSGIDNFAIELLEKRGYQYIYAPSIAPDLRACLCVSARRQATHRQAATHQQVKYNEKQSPR